MQVEIKTVYSKDAILNALNYAFEEKKRKAVLMAVMTAVVAVLVLINILLDKLSTTAFVCMIAILVLDFIYAFLFFISPSIVFGKAKNKKLSVTYTFTEENVCVSTNGEGTEENTSVCSFEYSEISKVSKKGNSLFIYTTKGQGFFVDLSETYSSDVVKLKALLEKTPNKKRFIWE